MTGIESRSSAGWQRRQDMPGQPGHDQRPPVAGWQGFTDSLYRNRVTLTAVLLIAIQVFWKGNVLAHSYFQQDDFEFTARAIGHHLTDPNYILRIEAGHLMPGGWLVMWFLARISAYDWGLWGGTMLVLQTLAGLAIWKVLRTLFGNRPMILIPLAVALFTPLTIKGMSWFAAGIISVPLQLAIPMAVDAHVRYVRGRRPLHLALAVFWVLFGMAFYVKAGAIPLLLFALTSAFLIPGSWPWAMLVSLRRFWRAWAIYAALIAGQAALYTARVHTSAVSPHTPLAFSDATRFGSDLITKAFIPGVFGGPWSWVSFGGPTEPLANPPSGLVWLSRLAAVLVIGASLWFRRRAWRSWAILLGWLIFADVIPVAAGRLEALGPSVGLESRYVADAVPVLAICLGLAFLPLIGERDAYRAVLSEPTARLLPTITGATLGIFLLGSIWSVNDFTAKMHMGSNRSYVATANAALQAAPQGTAIVDQYVPPSVLNPFLAGTQGYSYQSKVLGPLARKLHKNIVWVTAPQVGVVSLRIFDPAGRLHLADVAGVKNVAHKGCYLPSPRGLVVPLTYTVPPGSWTMQVAYYGTAIKLAVYFGGNINIVTLPRSGLANGFVQVKGGGSNLLIRTIGSGGACIATITIGVLRAMPFAPATPALPMPG